MKKIIGLLVLISVFVSCKKDGTKNVHPEFDFPELVLDSLEVLSSDIPMTDYTDVTFLNSNLGYAISNDGLIVKTTDGGLHWQQLAAVNAYLHRIQFVNNQVGYVIGADASRAYFFKTTDAGTTWAKTDLNTPSSNWPNGIFFLNANTGFITGQDFFRKTTDGGATWTDIMANTQDDFIDVQFKNDKEGYATANGGRYYKTVNGGASWTLQLAKSTDHLLEIFVSPSRVYAKSGVNALVDLATGDIVMTTPNAASRFVFLTDNKCVGIGQHYDTGFWPYGDIFLTNNAWVDNVSRTFTPSQAINFNAIAKADDHKTIMIGGGHLQTTVVQLNH
jgi:hypothetical protein